MYSKLPTNTFWKYLKYLDLSPHINCLLFDLVAVVKCSLQGKKGLPLIVAQHHSTSNMSTTRVNWPPFTSAKQRSHSLFVLCRDKQDRRCKWISCSFAFYHTFRITPLLLSWNSMYSCDPETYMLHLSSHALLFVREQKLMHKKFGHD